MLEAIHISLEATASRLEDIPIMLEAIHIGLESSTASRLASKDMNRLQHNRNVLLCWRPTSGGLRYRLESTFLLCWRRFILGGHR